MAYAGCNVSLAICAGVLCAYIAPAAAGSGIPEVKAYLNGVDAHSILAPSTLFVKVSTSHTYPFHSYPSRAQRKRKYMWPLFAVVNDLLNGKNFSMHFSFHPEFMII